MKIISNTGKIKESYESCLSVPKYKGKVKRKDKLEVEYEDINRKQCKMTASGFLSRVILHEIDHLDGILFVDRLEHPKELEKVKFGWE
ncbi:MAG: peptide deformylase [Alphaproteobacteria bacterium]|nr:peptide deformylase [Alphaproteobacteria bacterium]